VLYSNSIQGTVRTVCILIISKAMESHSKNKSPHQHQKQYQKQHQKGKNSNSTGGKHGPIAKSHHKLVEKSKPPHKFTNNNNNNNQSPQVIKAGNKPSASAPATSSSSSSAIRPARGKLSELQQKFAKKLEGSRFRIINEQLYTTTGLKCHLQFMCLTV
jgi:hypothetical protein